MSGQPLFKDRVQAGRILAEHLKAAISEPDLLILALPRGGVPVGFEVAQAIDAALDVIVVRKLGVPGEEELAMGAIASGGVCVLNGELIEDFGISSDVVEMVTAREQREIELREVAYRNGHAAAPVQGRSVVLVDDGLATGATMLAAVRAVRARKPERVIVAVPVASHEACDALHEADLIVCTATPESFVSVGTWYEDFSQTTDDEVMELLRRGREGARISSREPAD